MLAIAAGVLLVGVPAEADWKVGLAHAQTRAEKKHPGAQAMFMQGCGGDDDLEET